MTLHQILALIGLVLGLIGIGLAIAAIRENTKAYRLCLKEMQHLSEMQKLADSVGQDQSRPSTIYLSDEEVAKAALKTMRDIERES